jgi:Helix-turn-helix domain
MAGHWSDRNIALTLNRLRLRSGTGLTWTEQRVYAVRHRMGLPAYDPEKDDGTAVSLEQASKILGVSNTVVRRLMNDGILPAIQVSPGAPWQIQRASLDSPEVQDAAKGARPRPRASRAARSEQLTPRIPGL